MRFGRRRTGPGSGRGADGQLAMPSKAPDAPLAMGRSCMMHPPACRTAFAAEAALNAWVVYEIRTTVKFDFAGLRYQQLSMLSKSTL